MDSVIAFYNNLFTIEVAVFGIIAAAVFVFIQIVYSQFSYRGIYLLFKNTLLILYFILSTSSLLLTAIGSFILSFPNIDSLMGNILTVELFRNEVFASILLFFSILSLAFFISFLIINIRYIRPSKVAILISKKISNNMIQDYLLKKYGVPAPDDWLTLLQLQNTLSHNHKEGKGISKEQSTNKQSEEQLTNNLTIYENTQKKVAQASDPLDSLDALMFTAIKNSDLVTISEINTLLLSISTSFIDNNVYEKETTEWSPYLGLIQKYFNYFTDRMKIYLEICDRHNFTAAKIKILELSEMVSKQNMFKCSSEIYSFFELWQETADKSIEESPQVFIKLIEVYDNLLNVFFKEGLEKYSNQIDEIFRHLGWLGERLISLKGIEDKPLMHVLHDTNEFDQLFNSVFSYSYKYNHHYQDSYPLIYFDLIYVLIRQFIAVYKAQKSVTLKENVFDCLYVYSSFAKAAISHRNSRGAALAYTRLKECYDELLGEHLEECAKEAIKLLVNIGGISSRHKEELQKVEFLSKSIHEEVIDLAAISPFRNEVESEVWNSHVGMDSDWDFVIEMGKRMQTNFGFMFDWETGKLYPDDDPKRK